MARKTKTPAPEKENSERWLLTYADLITLLLIFFIVLYTMSKVDSQKFSQVTQSLAIMFGNSRAVGVLDGGQAVIPAVDKAYKEKLEMERIREQLRKVISQKGLDGKVSTHIEERGLIVRIRDSILFYSGSAELVPNAKSLVSEVGKLLEEVPNLIRIEGHTDSDPIHTMLFLSNWELSTARATNVLQFILQSSHIDPSRLSAAGYGEYRSISSNDTPENKSLNRRVDIVLLSSVSEKSEPVTSDHE